MSINRVFFFFITVSYQFTHYIQGRNIVSILNNYEDHILTFLHCASFYWDWYALLFIY